MSCANYIIDLLYEEKNYSMIETIDVALEIIKECLDNIQENENEETIEEIKTNIHNEILIINGDYVRCY